MREGTEPPEDAPRAGDVGAPLEPVDAAAPPSTDSGSVARSLGLGAIAFAATILLIAGLFGLINWSTHRTGTTVSPSPTPAAKSAIPTDGPSAAPAASAGIADAVLVGAGDITDCSLDKGAATAKLVEAIVGIVFTAGDNAYPDGTAKQFTDCYDPRFSSGEHGNDADVGPFWKALYDAGADIVVNGHDHDYERFAPQDPGGRADDTRGIREFVVGTGGAVLRTFPTTRPNSVIRASVAHGVIRFTLRQSNYDWTFISTTGEFRDSGAGACH